MSWTAPFATALTVIGPDLTFRQAAILEALCTTNGPQTVRGLAAQLGMSKPVITRGLNSLSASHLAKRIRDPQDRRSVDVFETFAGRQFYASLTGAMGIAR